MLTELYDQLHRLYEDFLHFALRGARDDAKAVMSRVVTLEQRIACTPAQSMDDVLIKLQMLRNDLIDDMADHQRRMLDDAIAAIRGRAVH